jgi:hypothetical protein
MIISLETISSIPSLSVKLKVHAKGAKGNRKKTQRKALHFNTLRTLRFLLRPLREPLTIIYCSHQQILSVAKYFRHFSSL